MASNDSPIPAVAGFNAFIRPLTLADVKQCVEVESAFPEHERCSEEKFEYRLAQCHGLSLGLFIKQDNNEKLIGHVIALRFSYDSITDGAMKMPDNWQLLPPNQSVILNGDIIGNHSNGKSIGIHSVAISTEYQGKGVGRALMNAYTKYIKDSGISADRIMLIAHDHLIRFYESVGFENRGASACTFAGGGWTDMVFDL